MITIKRQVILSDLNNKSKFGTGSHYKTYGYTIKDLAQLLDLSEPYIRNLICDNKLDPTSLLSIIEFYNSNRA